MKIPKQIKTLLKKREDYAMNYIACESKVSSFLKEELTEKEIEVLHKGDIIELC